MTSNLATVIIPAARKSDDILSRPCWLRPHPAGSLVIHHILRALDVSSVSRVILVVAQDHVSRWLSGTKEAMERHLTAVTAGRPVIILPLSHETNSAAETVAFAIRTCSVTGSIFIKDQDGCFNHRVVPNVNYVCGLRLTEHSEVDAIPSKSFIQATGTLLTNIVEKRLVSDVICVGGYAFRCAVQFLETLAAVEDAQRRAAENLKGSMKFVTSSAASGSGSAEASPSTSSTTSTAVAAGVGGRLFISHVVQYQMLHEGKVFGVDYVAHFDDWKTEDGWRRFAQRFRNIEVSLEGVLFVERNEFDVLAALPGASISPEASNAALQPASKNIDYLKSLRRDRSRITVRTTRPASMRQATEALLEQHGVPFDNIIFDALLATTFVVSAYDDHHVPSPSAVVYSVPKHVQHQLLESVLH